MTELNDVHPIEIETQTNTTVKKDDSSSEDLMENYAGSETDPTTNVIANVTLKLYEGWIGNNTLCCKGRIILGPDRKLFVITLILILLPAVVYGPVIMP